MCQSICRYNTRYYALNQVPPTLYSYMEYWWQLVGMNGPS